MSETKENKRKRVIEEFRRRGESISRKEYTGPVLDNGYSGVFTELWKWC